MYGNPYISAHAQPDPDVTPGREWGRRCCFVAVGLMPVIILYARDYDTCLRDVR